MSLKQKVISGLSWSAGSRFLAQLISWTITLIVIRLLSPADYGLMALAMVFVSFLVMLNEMGLGAAVVQCKELDHDILRSLFSLILIASGAFYLLLTVFAPLIARFYEEPRLVLLVRVLALEFLINGFSVLPRSLLTREMKFRQIGIIDLVSAISGSLTTLVLALAGYGVWSLVGGTLMIRVVSTIGLNITQPFLFLPRTNMKGAWTFFEFGGYVTISRIIWYLYSRTDILIIGKIFGKDLLGFYSVGLMLATLPMEKVSGMINQVAFPAFSSVQTEPEVFGRHFFKAVRVMSFIAFPVLWGISSISPEIVHIFLGEKWSHAALPMQIIALVIPLRMINSMMNPAVLGKGRPGIQFIITIVPAILMPAAFFIGSFWGLLGVSLAWVIGFPFAFFLNLRIVLRVIGGSMKDLFFSLWKPVLFSSIMYGAVIMAKKIGEGYPAPLLMLIVFIVVGASVYVAATLSLGRKEFQEIRALIKK